ncbi:MAG: DNA pilot protein [Microviridae sp.]|nr:MAG: DNA pilot protein [Microviridae sp.]
MGLLSILGSVGGALVNPLTSIITNNQQRDMATDAYNRQRADALSDWDRQNAYNSPASQMQRYTDAGLNPNLIYGQSTTAAPVRSTDYNVPRIEAPKADIPAVLAQYQDTKLKQAQTNNIIALTDAAHEEANLKRAQTASLLSGIDKNSSDIGYTSWMKSQGDQRLPLDLDKTRAEIHRSNLEAAKTKADTDYTIAQNERSAITQSYSVKEAAERIKMIRLQQANTAEERDNIRAMYNNLLQTGELQQLDIDLKKQGIQPHDALWQRKISELWNYTKPARDLFKFKMGIR